jgi:hypothetical protein
MRENCTASGTRTSSPGPASIPWTAPRTLNGATFPARLAALVAHHSAARIEADVPGMTAGLTRIWQTGYGGSVIRRRSR